MSLQLQMSPRVLFAPDVSCRYILWGKLDCLLGRSVQLDSIVRQARWSPIHVQQEAFAQQLQLFRSRAQPGLTVFKGRQLRRRAQSHASAPQVQ